MWEVLVNDARSYVGPKGHRRERWKGAGRVFGRAWSHRAGGCKGGGQAASLILQGGIQLMLMEETPESHRYR